MGIRYGELDNMKQFDSQKTGDVGDDHSEL